MRERMGPVCSGVTWLVCMWGGRGGEWEGHEGGGRGTDVREVESTLLRGHVACLHKWKGEQLG